MERMTHYLVAYQSVCLICGRLSYRKVIMGIILCDIFQVSAIREGPGWKRRDVVVGDGHQRVICKLWNEHVEKPVTEGYRCRISNVLVDEWNHTKSLTSTDETDYTVSNLFAYL